MKFDRCKEEGTNRQKLDKEDREKICSELQKHIHPLDSGTDKLINVVTGCVASVAVNVQNALEIGERMAYHYRNSIPGGFYKPLKHVVVTMSAVHRV